MSEVPDTAAPPRERRAWRALVLPLAVLALAVAVLWHWQQTRTESAALQEELARRLRDIDTDSREARLIARQAQEAQREFQIAPRAARGAARRVAEPAARARGALPGALAQPRRVDSSRRSSRCSPSPRSSCSSRAT